MTLFDIISEASNANLSTSQEEDEQDKLNGNEHFEKLKSELTEMERIQALKKEANKLIRKGVANPIAFKAAIEAKIHGLTITLALVEKILTPNRWGKMGFEGYELTNLNSKIKRVKSKINAFESAGTVSTATIAESQKLNYTYDESTTENRVMFCFDFKPRAEVCQWLKRNGFKWSPTRNAWVRLLTENGQYKGRRMREYLKDNPSFLQPA